MILAGALALLAASAPAEGRIVTGQLIIRERIVVRVPADSAPPRVTKWKTKRMSRCVAAEGLAGAAFMIPGSVDLITRAGTRVRAEFASSCPAIDFYSGFYLTPSPDGMICANRDALHTRSGGECQIKRFRTLVPDE